MQRTEDIAKKFGFSIQSSEEVSEIDGRAYLMRHDKSGARVLLLQNDDPDKSFSISFKTPAADDTGVFHILEHSVLCGSEKFPVKEPFVNLLKSSMQTFLNAMTFPDKTMYPVASTNEKDLLNLMDVYLDAVFHPQIYNKPEIFEQEGWHLEIEDDDPETLAFNGVVFNEMKGFLSDPDSVLYDALSAALFPDTTYRYEAGGIPSSIVSLTYEDFLDSHRRHYNPKNSYIILYGNFDAETFLSFIDKKYLSSFADGDADGAVCAAAPNALEMQSAVENLNVKCEMVTTPDNASVAFGYVIGDFSEIEKVYAVDILLDAVMGSNESALKKRLLKAHLANDCNAQVIDGIAQPFAMLQLKGLKELAEPAGVQDGQKGCTQGASYDETIARANEIIRQEVAKLADGGLDMDAVEAALSHEEFVLRERNFGYPDGVILSMNAMNSWLYDEDMPCGYIAFEQVFASLRKKLHTGYFEDLLREVFLDNNHIAQVELVPVASVGENELEKEISGIARSISEDEIGGIDASLERLRRAQAESDSEEALATLPMLKISDIDKAPKDVDFGMRKAADVRYLGHDINTNGIAYVNEYFDLQGFAFDEMPYLSVLSMLLGKLDTRSHSALELDTALRGQLGDLSFRIDVFCNAEADSIPVKFLMSGSMLYENVSEGASLAFEILHTTKFDDVSKIKDILIQRRVGMEQIFATAGNSVAISRATSYCWKPSVLNEQISGVDFYIFLRDLIEDFDDRSEDLVCKLENLLFRVRNSASLISYAGDAAVFGQYIEQRGFAEDEYLVADPSQKDAVGSSRADAAEEVLAIPDPLDRHEAFAAPCDVTFSALACDRNTIDSKYSAAWIVASKILTLDYLWNEVRVVGGAYGVGFNTDRAGMTFYYSYRDPHVDETIDRFDQAGKWLSEFDPSEKDFRGYVISSVASFDNPLKPRTLLRKQDAMYFSGYTNEMRAKMRDDVVNVEVADVVALATKLDDMAAEKHVCCVGNASIIDSSKEGFEVIDLFSKPQL